MERIVKENSRVFPATSVRIKVALAIIRGDAYDFDSTLEIENRLARTTTFNSIESACRECFGVELNYTDKLECAYDAAEDFLASLLTKLADVKE